VVGYTGSADFCTTANALDNELNGTMDGFIAIMDEDLSMFIFSTFIGGTDVDIELLSSVQVSSSGDMLAAVGYSDSDDLITTPGAFDRTLRGMSDIFMITVNLTTKQMDYCTFIGGSKEDAQGWTPIAFDEKGYVYVVGETASTDIIITEGAWDRSHNGDDDLYIAKVHPTPCQVQAAPVNLLCEPGDGFVLLSWDQVRFNGSRLESVRIFRGDDPENMWPIYDAGPHQTYFRDNSSLLKNGVEYYYRLATVNSVGQGPRGKIESALPMGLPGRPSGLTAVTIIENGSVDLSWDPLTDTGGGEIMGYYLFRGLSISSPIRIETLDNVTQHIDDHSNLVLGVNQYYSVSAFNDRGEGPRSDVVVVKPVSMPSPPRGFKAFSGDKRVDLVWQTPTENGGAAIAGYRIFKSSTGLDYLPLTDVGPDEFTYLDEEVENGRTYHYYVVAINAADIIGHPAVPALVKPFAKPSAPGTLIAVATDGQVNLSWSPPHDDGGMDITGYVIYRGESSGSINLPLTVGNVTSYPVEDVTNGVTYYFQVVAQNAAGVGPRSNSVIALPMGLPSAPVDLAIESSSSGIELTWRPPTKSGGSLTLHYLIWRGLSTDDLVVIENITGTSFTDKTAQGGLLYHYRLQAGNEMGNGGLTETVDVTVLVAPGKPTLLNATGSEGRVFLNWSTPADDGGSEIVGYFLLRGTSATMLVEAIDVGLVVSYTDDQVQNGTMYYYSVYAVNSIGDGVRSEIAQSVPTSRPSSPKVFDLDVTNNKVVLSWIPPSSFGSASVTGFRIYRGIDDGDLSALTDTGAETSFIDEDVDAGETYYYRVVPLCEFGEGEPTQTLKGHIPAAQEPLSAGLLLILVVLLVIIVALAMVVMMRRKSDAVEGAMEAQGPGSAASVVVDVPSGEDGIPYFMIEEMFLVYKDGRLIVDCARPECETADADLMSGMLIAVQGLIQDGLERGGALESIKFGSNRVLLVSGEHIHVAVVLYGRPTKDLIEGLTDLVPRIEGNYAGRIEDWVGDPDDLAGIDEFLAPFLGSTSHLTRDDVMPEETELGVKLLSAIDFHQGYVRLKMAAVNGTDEVIADAAMEFTYNHDMLRMERVEPDTLVVRGDRIFLGTIKPKEKLTVAFMFDPQICQETFIDGMLIYYDPKGELKHVQMKRRHADVVCPIFFTREHANTAMLKRLIKDKLRMTDTRAFSYPQTQPPGEILRLAQNSLGEGDLQLVRGFVEEGSPYKAEVWYYAETKVKAYQMVIRLGVLEDSGTLDIYAASTSMEPITGLLADFRRELDRAMEKRDDVLRMELMQRPLMLDQAADEE